MLKQRTRSVLYRAALIEPLERRVLLSGTITAVRGQNFDVGQLGNYQNT
jgi:hypothetical protein